MIILVILCCQVIQEGLLAQVDALETKHQELETSAVSSIFEDPVEVESAQLAPMLAFRGNPSSKLGDVNHSMYAAEIGVGLVYGDYYWYSGSGPLCFLIGTSSSWQYIAPYASEEGEMMIEDGDSTKSRMRDYLLPFVLNAGAQFGFGDTDIFPRVGL